MSLQEELDRVLTYCQDQAPSNESETCEWVILPLLWAMGYDRFQIRSRAPDGAGRYPDYTILPNTDHTWFLEAKGWKEKLSHEHMNQALFSAFSTGNRWVVLSNGQEWQLYDVKIEGTSKDRLVCTVRLSDKQNFLELCDALSPKGIASGRIEEFSMTSRQERILREQLSSPDSETIRAAVQALQGCGAKITSADLVSFIAGSGRQPIEGTAGGDKASPAQAAASKQAAYLLTPISNDGNIPAKESLTKLLNGGWFALRESATGLKALKPGDRMCFYEAGKGVVAEATVLSYPERAEAPNIRDAAKYPWRFKVADVRFFREPRALTPELRRQMDAFANKNPEAPWPWLVQSTAKLTKHDFELLTRS